MREIGAVLGLIVGYVTKYHLDRRFVFRPELGSPAPAGPASLGAPAASGDIHDVASPPQLSGTGWLGRATWTITILGFAASAAIVLLFSVLEIIRHGGNAYKHGDWLVNALEEPVRRGAFGSALLHLSDALQVSPLLVVGMLQVVLVAALYLLTLAVLRNLPWQPALLLLVITPPSS